jgi:hypothetical protein
MKTFTDAATSGIITSDQAKHLETFFGGAAPQGAASAGSPVPGTAVGAMAASRFDLVHMLWYAGALIIIGSMSLFSTLAFNQMGTKALLATAIIYGGLFLAAGHHLWHRRGLTTPGGLLITVAVSMVPLAVFCVQDITGWWLTDKSLGHYKDFYIWIKGGYLPMEIATIIVSVLALRRYPYPFILFITAFVIWFMSMDVADWLSGGDRSWALRKKVSLAFGLALIPIAWLVDLRHPKRDFGFWLHLVAAVTFWGGLTMQDSNSEIGKFIYAMINVGLLCFAVFLRRQVYAVFGTVGIMIYLGHLANKVFKDSLLFPFALTLLGIAIIGLGLLYLRNAARIETAVTRALPNWLMKLRPAVRD